MKKVDLIMIMADLELANQEIKEELTRFDQLMRRVGFVNGIETVKATALELTRQNPPNKDKVR